MHGNSVFKGERECEVYSVFSVSSVYCVQSIKERRSFERRSERRSQKSERERERRSEKKMMSASASGAQKMSERWAWAPLRFFRFSSRKIAIF